MMDIILLSWKVSPSDFLAWHQTSPFLVINCGGSIGERAWTCQLTLHELEECQSAILWSHNSTSLDRNITVVACTAVIANQKNRRSLGFTRDRCSAVHRQKLLKRTGSHSTINRSTHMVASYHSYLAQEPSVLCKFVPLSALSMERWWWWLNVLCSHSNTTGRSV